MSTFELLPADLLQKIFHQLPFKDRVRLAGVNRLFRNASKESINKMKSLIVNDDLISVVALSSQSLSSLFESCSLTLESIDATDHSFNKRNKWLPRLMADFMYSKLKHLEIVVIDNVGTKELIRKCPHSRSIVLHMSGELEWPEDIIFEKLEKLEIRSITDDEDINYDREYINLSSMLRPLVGKIPNLKQLSIKGDLNFRCFFPMQDLNDLLSSTPMIEVLNLNLYGLSTQEEIKITQEFQTAIPKWHLPKLTTLTIKGIWELSSSVLPKFPALFPQLKSLTLRWLKQIDDQSVVALSQLEHLRELRLCHLYMTKEQFTQLIISLPSIVILEIGALRGESKDQDVDDQVLMALSGLENLRELCIWKAMTSAEVVALVTSLPLLDFLKIKMIVDARNSEAFNDFLQSTAAIWHRNLEIQFDLHHVDIGYDDLKMGQIEACMEEVKGNGGPVVEVYRKEYLLQILSIRYKSLVK